jgi:hypothetical protein
LVAIREWPSGVGRKIVRPMSPLVVPDHLLESGICRWLEDASFGKLGPVLGLLLEVSFCQVDQLLIWW